MFPLFHSSLFPGCSGGRRHNLVQAPIQKMTHRVAIDYCVTDNEHRHQSWDRLLRVLNLFTSRSENTRH